MTDETKSWHGGKPVGSQVATFGRTVSSEEKYKKNTAIRHKILSSNTQMELISILQAQVYIWWKIAT